METISLYLGHLERLYALEGAHGGKGTDKVNVLLACLSRHAVHRQGGSLTVYFKLIQMLTGDFKIDTGGTGSKIASAAAAAAAAENLKMDIVRRVPRLFWEPEPLTCPWAPSDQLCHQV